MSQMYRSVKVLCVYGASFIHFIMTLSYSGISLTLCLKCLNRHQIGNGPVEDSLNSFLMNMNDQVDAFAEFVREDEHLAKVNLSVCVRREEKMLERLC